MTNVFKYTPLMEDISTNVTGMSPDVRAFCLETGCLRQFLSSLYGGGDLGEVDPAWCCGPCSQMNCVASKSDTDLQDPE